MPSSTMVEGSGTGISRHQPARLRNIPPLDTSLPRPRSWAVPGAKTRPGHTSRQTDGPHPGECRRVRNRIARGAGPGRPSCRPGQRQTLGRIAEGPAGEGQPQQASIVRQLKREGEPIAGIARAAGRRRDLHSAARSVYSLRWFDHLDSTSVSTLVAKIVRNAARFAAIEQAERRNAERPFLTTVEPGGTRSRPWARTPRPARCLL